MNGGTGIPNAIAQTGKSVTPQVACHRMLRRIGGGAYGEVWLAQADTDSYRAIKFVYRRNFEDERPYAREFKGIKLFEPISREHPGLVDVLGVTLDVTNPSLSYVMELADDATQPEVAPPDKAAGANPSQKQRIVNPDTYAPKTLHRILRPSDRSSEGERPGRHRLPAKTCVEIGCQLAAALSFMHERGVVHRDVKPSNVIFVNNQPKLADPGLAAGVGENVSFVGTEGYVPPEGPGEPQADIYALGKLLYEMMTGLNPQEDNSVSPAEKFPSLPTDWAESPDHEDLNDLCHIVLRACDRNLSRRYKTAQQVYSDLEMLRSGKSLRMRKLQRKVRDMQAILAFAGIVLIVGFIVAGVWISAARADAQRRRRALAESLLQTGDALAANHRFAEAKERVNRSWDMAEEMKLSTIPAELSMLDIYRFSPPPLLTLTGHVGKVTCVGVRDQHILFSGGEDGTIRVWSCPLGRQQFFWLAHNGGVTCMAISPDRALLVSGGMDNRIKVWDPEKRVLLKVIEGHTNRISSVDFSPD